MSEVTLCVLLWAIEGRSNDLAAYEDKVLDQIADHGGTVVNRLQRLEDHDGPTEVHILEFPSQLALDTYMNDERRLALAGERERCLARTEVIRVKPV